MEPAGAARARSSHTNVRTMPTSPESCSHFGGTCSRSSRRVITSFALLTVTGFGALGVVACSGSGGDALGPGHVGAPYDPDGASGDRRWQGDVDWRSCDRRGADVETSALASAVRCASDDADDGAVLFALAVCGDLAADNTLTLQPRGGRAPASLAVQGRTRIASPLRVAGSFTSLLGIDAHNTVEVDGNVATSGDYRVSAPARIAGDALVGGVLEAQNTVSVGGVLRANDVVGPGAVEATSTSPGPAQVAPPLECANAPDVPALVRAAWGPGGAPVEPGAIGGPGFPIPEDAWRSIREPTRATLGCDLYRFGGVEVNNELTLRIEGHTVIVVDGGLRVAAPTRVEVAPGGSLVLLVGGSLEVDNTLEIVGGGARSWIGVGQRVRIASPTRLEGWLVAPRANLDADNTLELTGAAMVHDLRVASPLVVRPGVHVSRSGCGAAP